MLENNNSGSREAWYHLVLDRLKDLKRDSERQTEHHREDLKEVHSRLDKLDQSLASIKAQATLIGAGLAFLLNELAKWARDHLK